jgi:hypothetical protein
VSGTRLWPTTRFLLLSDICGRHAVGRPPRREDGSVIYSYSLLTLRSKSRRTHDHILLSHLRPYVTLIRDSPNLEGQVLVFISPRNRVAQLYLRALGYLFVASYDLQGYGGGFLSRLHKVKVKVKVILRPTVNRPVRPGVRHPSGTRDQFFPFSLSLFLDSCRFVDVGRPF